MWCLWNLGLLAEPLMGSFGLIAVYILTGAAGNLLSTCYNWVRPTARLRRASFSGRRGSVRRGFRHCRRADRAAQVEAAADSAVRAQASAQVGDLLCRDQSGHRPFGQLRQRVHRRGNRQFGAHRRLSVRVAVCCAAWCRASARRAAFFKRACASPSPRSVMLLVLFGFYLAHIRRRRG